MNLLNQLKTYLELKKKLEIKNLKISEKLQLNKFGAFVPEIFSHPSEPFIYLAFKNYKYNVVFKKALIVIDDELLLEARTTVIGEKYNENMRERFKIEMFDEALAALSYESIASSQLMATRVNEMRENQKAKR